MLPYPRAFDTHGRDNKLKDLVILVILEQVSERLRRVTPLKEGLDIVTSPSGRVKGETFPFDDPILPSLVHEDGVE